jgi:hypothetical protein
VQNSKPTQKNNNEKQTPADEWGNRCADQQKNLGRNLVGGLGGDCSVIDW